MNATQFEDAVRLAFHELETNLDHRFVGVTSNWLGHTARFQGPYTEVSVNFETGSAPWVVIRRTTPHGLGPDAIGLGVLLIYLGVDPRPTASAVVEPVLLNDEQLREALTSQASLLFKHAIALLRGDFALLRPVNALAQELVSEGNRFATNPDRGKAPGAGA